ncbi:MAG: transcriptional regulator PpsR [Gammaproteobacteria bacterium]|nr:transcriptional regulator PpsR [Gammaproteobacteria bacterium]
MKTFKAPRKALDGLDAGTVAALVTASSDIALVLDRRGVVRDIAFGNPELAAELGADWVGKPFNSLVTVDSRPKIEALFAELDAPEPRARQANHPSPGGATVAVSWSLRRLGEDGGLLAQGRDLRAVAALQQRLIEAEQSLERDYSKLRLAEARYRLLLQSSAEPTVVVDLGTQRIVEANPVAARLLGDDAKRLAGRPLGESLDAASGRQLPEWIGALRAAGRAEPLRARLVAGRRECRLAASVFRQDNSSHALLRIESAGDADPAAAANGHAPAGRFVEVFQRLPDALVVCDAGGRILAANRSFLDLAQLASEEQARNESLERWLGRPGVDLGVLTANLRQGGEVRLFATTLRGELGSSVEVEISATRLSGSDEPAYAYAIRNVERRRAVEPRDAKALPRSVEQMTELVGRVSLKELVRETTDVIERLCIEAALELTRDNRASAAEMLGLSRQSLYVKLRRYGLGDLDSAERR